MTPPAPFKGLRVFEDTEVDVPFFFGRDRERGLIEANLMASRLTVLYGETGVGKSSLLRAGVAHHLRGLAQESLERRGEPEHAIVVFDDWRDDPVDALKRACAEEVTRALGGSVSPPAGDAALADTLRAWQQLLGGDLFVILDQLEEYFLYHQGDDGPHTFAGEFPDAVGAPDLRVNFLLAIREDALAKLDAFKARIPNVLGNYLRLEHLDRNAARAAIVGPVERYNALAGAEAAVGVEPALVEAVLDEVAAGERVETPHLQLVMRRVWDEEQMQNSRMLRLETLRALGGSARIVGDHVDRALASLTRREQNHAAAMFDHLVTPSGTKIALELDDLSRYANASHADAVVVLEKLGADRIIRSVEGARYEIFHDVLARPVLAWKARHDAERARRRLVRVVALASAAVAAMAAITLFAVLQRSDARTQARIAEARALSSQALSQLQEDPQLSLSLALRSVRQDPTPSSEEVLRQALLAAHERRILRSGGPVRSVDFGPDGRVLTASDDGTARLWSSRGRLLFTLRHRGPVTVARFSPDGALFVTASRDGTAREWWTRSGVPRATLQHGAAVVDAAFAPGGRTLLTAAEDGAVRVWSRAGKLLRVIRVPRPVQRALPGPNGLVLVVAAHRALVFDASGSLLRRLPQHGVIAAAFGRRGGRIATGSLDHTAAIWGARDGRLIHRLPRHKGAVTDVVFGPRGRLLATTSADGATRVWDASKGKRLALMLGHANAVVSASFSPDGTYIATASADGTARVWDAVSGRIHAVLRGHGDTVAAVAFSRDGSTVGTASTDGTARLWDADTVADLQPLMRVHGTVATVAFSPDGRSFVEGGADGTVRIVTGETTRLLRHPAAVTSAVFGSDGRQVFTADATRTLRVWDATSGRLLRSRAAISTGPLAVGADGLVAAPVETGIALLDARTLTPARVLPGGSVAAFSPDGRLVAVGDADGTIVLRRIDGSRVATLRGHTDAITGLVFSRDARLLASSSRDHDARVWRVADGTSTLLRGHFGPVLGIALTPDSEVAVTAGPVTAGVWSTGTGRLYTYLHGSRAPLTAVALSPDGRTVVAASRDGTVRTYRCALCGGTDSLVAAAAQRLASLA